MTENDPLIITVSDVHLGALKSKLDSFKQFLKAILNGLYGNDLQAFVILGDFFDLCTDVPKTLLTDSKIQEIFTLLLDIKKRMHLIFALGNHEIPITGNVFTGTYDDKFNRRKEIFLNKFKNGNFDELFDEQSFCQYILLREWNNSDRILLYDSQDQIEGSPINTLNIEGLNLDSDYKCLMMHGYQFEKDYIRFFIGPIWKSLISSDNIDFKEPFDYFWNEIIKQDKKVKPTTIKEMKDDLIKLKALSPDIIDHHFSRLNNLNFDFLKIKMRVMQKWEKTRKYEYYLEGIEDFLEDDIFSGVNHIIYGHSHERGKFSETLHNRSVEIVNDGAWQHVYHPSYAGIYYKGKIEVELLRPITAPPQV